MLNKIKQCVEEAKSQVIEDRRDFHKYPESGWTEFRTAAVIAKRLMKLGYGVGMGAGVIKKEAMMGGVPGEELARHMERALEQGADPKLVKAMEGGFTGVVGWLDCGPGPVTAIRFDIDANDIDEAKDDNHRPFKLNFASQNPGVMHACGHDGHAAMGLGVAEILADLKDQLKGKILLIFQPAEEGARGARAMVEAGVVNGLDHILGFHLGFQANQSHMLICGTGKFLATTKLDIRFKGKPAHAGANPHQGRNALLAAASAALNLHAIPRHGKGASRITVGTLNAGQGRNIIPHRAVMKIETRGETSEIDEFMVLKARAVINGAALMHDVDCDIEQVGGTKSGESSPEMESILSRVAKKTGLFGCIEEHVDFGASEDFAHMMTHVQNSGGTGTYFMVGSDLAAGHHECYFDFDEASLSRGMELILNLLVELGHLFDNHE